MDFFDDGAAGRIRSLKAAADELRNRADTVDRAIAAVVWRSSSAARFHERAAIAAARLRRSAAQLEHAAALLAAHVRSAREVQAGIVGAARTAQAATKSATERGEDLVTSLARIPWQAAR